MKKDSHPCYSLRGGAVERPAGAKAARWRFPNWERSIPLLGT